MIRRIPVSNGEILDKFSILEIKLSYVIDNVQKTNIEKEKKYLLKYVKEIISPNIQNLYDDLIEVNKKLWIVEDNLRNKEKTKIFDNEFIDLARKVYIYNDTRANIKKQINILTNSTLIEEKIYHHE